MLYLFNLFFLQTVDWNIKCYHCPSQVVSLLENVVFLGSVRYVIARRQNPSDAQTIHHLSVPLADQKGLQRAPEEALYGHRWSLAAFLWFLREWEDLVVYFRSMSSDAEWDAGPWGGCGRDKGVVAALTAQLAVKLSAMVGASPWDMWWGVREVLIISTPGRKTQGEMKAGEKG